MGPTKSCRPVNTGKPEYRLLGAASQIGEVAGVEMANQWTPAGERSYVGAASESGEGTGVEMIIAF